MMKKTGITAKLVTGLMVVAGVAATNAMAGCSMGGGCNMHDAAPTDATTAHHAADTQTPADVLAVAATQPAADMKCLTDALNAIEAARKAVRSGDTKVALAQLDKAQALIIQSKEGTAKPAAFANVTCPIMGSRIDPANVPNRLVRQYKGKKVAFCCGGCPAQWDKLSDAERDAKLKQSPSGS